MLTHDIDWFCIVNGIYVHLASAGGILPLSFRNRDILRELQHNVAVAPYLFAEEDVIDNDAFINQRFSSNPKGRKSYVVSFRDMARKGFISMDRTNLLEPNDNRYHIVCMPKKLDERSLQGLGIPVIPIEEKPELDLQPLRLLE